MVRWRAVGALASIGDAAVPALIKALQDMDADVRKEANRILAWIRQAGD